MYYRIVSASAASLRDMIPGNALLFKSGSVPLIVRLPQGATRVFDHPSYAYSEWHELMVVVCKGPIQNTRVSCTARTAALIFIATNELRTPPGLKHIRGEKETLYYQEVNGSTVKVKAACENGLTTYDFTVS